MEMSHVVVIGCGVVGAAIAYELSQVPGLKVTVVDKQLPAQGATAAALGVLMGIISHKTKGRAWQLRQASIQRYQTLIPELEAIAQRQIFSNSQGIIRLCGAEEDLAKWEQLKAMRRSQGWQLEIWDAAQVKSRCPQLATEQIQAAVYSPQDRQIDPVSLTLALVEAAKVNGVTFHFGITATACNSSLTATESQQIRQIQLSGEVVQVDWLVISAGLGSLPSLQAISQKMAQPELAQLVDIRPVLGQAIHLQLSRPVGNPNFQPVITSDDVHIVPYISSPVATEYWVGATVEFPADGQDIVPDRMQLDAVMQQAIACCPALAEATTLRTWSGLRPRPQGRSAPVIGQLSGFSNVLLATGHYRNGVLLAPATAQAVRQLILNV